MKFKIGDRVRSIRGIAPVNSVGTVVEIISNTDKVGVAYDTNVGGHNLSVVSRGGLCRNGYGWYENIHEILKVEEPDKEYEELLV